MIKFDLNEQIQFFGWYLPKFNSTLNKLARGGGRTTNIVEFKNIA